MTTAEFLADGVIFDMVRLTSPYCVGQPLAAVPATDGQFTLSDLRHVSRDRTAHLQILLLLSKRLGEMSRVS